MPTTDGLEDIVATQSCICDLDGKLGKLSYFGIDIHDLVRNSSFEETAYLLWHGVLPTKSQLEDVAAQLCANRTIPGPVSELMQLLPKSSAPMDVLRTTVSALSSFDLDAGDNSTEANRHRSIRLNGCHHGKYVCRHYIGHRRSLRPTSWWGERTGDAYGLENW